MFAPSQHQRWLEALDQCAGVMRALNIPYSLDGGTLLGLAREGTFIRYDKDLDITLLEQQDRLKELAAGLRTAGFQGATVRTVGGPVNTLKIVPARKGVRIDIVNKRDVDGMAAWTIYGKRDLLKTIPSSFYEDLATLEVDGFSFSVPREWRAYCVCRWGRAWRTPVLGPEYKRYSMDLAYAKARNRRETRA